jgi:hypothetical protein
MKPTHEELHAIIKGHDVDVGRTNIPFIQEIAKELLELKALKRDLQCLYDSHWKAR